MEPVEIKEEEWVPEEPTAIGGIPIEDEGDFVPMEAVAIEEDKDFVEDSVQGQSMLSDDFIAYDTIGERTRPVYAGAPYNPEIDTVANAIKYNWNHGRADALRILSTAAGGLDAVADWIFQETGEAPEDNESLMDSLERYFSEASQDIEPDMSTAPRKFFNRVAGAVVGGAPMAILEYSAAGRVFGPVAGFAFVDGMRAADTGDFETIAKATGWGGVLGYLFQTIMPMRGIKGIATATGLGGGMAAVEGGSLEDIAVGATALGVMHGGVQALRPGVPQPYSEPKQMITKITGKVTESEARNSFPLIQQTKQQQPIVPDGKSPVADSIILRFKEEYESVSKQLEQAEVAVLESEHFTPLKRAPKGMNKDDLIAINKHGLEINEQILAEQRAKRSALITEREALGAKLQEATFARSVEAALKEAERRATKIIDEYESIRKLPAEEREKSAITMVETEGYGLEFARSVLAPEGNDALKIGGRVMSFGTDRYETGVANQGMSNVRLDMIKDTVLDVKEREVPVSFEPLPPEFNKTTGRWESKTIQVGGMKKNKDTGKMEQVIDRTVTRLEKDISPRQSAVSGMLKPGAFMRQNTILISFTDAFKKYRIIIDNRIDHFKHHSELDKNKFFKKGLVTNVVKYVATDKGMLTVYERLPWKRRFKVMSALLEQESLGKNADTSIKNLKETYGLKDKEIMAYNRIREKMEELRLYLNKTFAMYDNNKGNIKRLPGYIPHMFMGDFRIWVKNRATGENEIVLPATTVFEAKYYTKKLIKKYGGQYDINYTKVKNVLAGDISGDAFIDTLRYLTARGESKQAEAVAATYTKLISERGMGRHKMGRKKDGGMGGFAGDPHAQKLTGKSDRKVLGDFEKGLNGFVDSAVGYAERMKFNHKWTTFITDADLNKYYPNTIKYAKAYADHAFGVKGKVTTWVNGLLGDWVGDTGVSRTLGYVNIATLATRLFNMRFFMSQLFQPFLVLPAKMAAMQAEGYSSSIISAHLTAMRSMVMPSAADKAAIQWAIQVRALDPKFIREATAGTFGDILKPGTTGKIGTTAKYATLMHTAGHIEVFSRAYADLTFYHFLKKAGVNNIKAIKDAADLTDTYMVEYNNMERPMIYGENGLGVLGTPAGLFKTFQHNYLSQMVEHIGYAKKGHIKPLSVFVGSQALLAGLTGVIAYEQADNIISFLNKSYGTTMPLATEFLVGSGIPDWLMKRGFNEEWAEYAQQALVSGLPSAVMGVDITSTMAAPGLSFGDLVSAPGLELIYDLGAELWNLKTKTATGRLTSDDAYSFWYKFVPSWMRPGVEAYYTEKMHGQLTGVSVPTASRKYRWRGTTIRDTEDWLKTVAFNAKAMDESLAFRRYYAMMKIKDSEKASKDSLAQAMLWSYMNTGSIPEHMQQAAQDHKWLDITTSVISLAELQWTSMINRMYQSANITDKERMEKLGLIKDLVREVQKIQDNPLKEGSR